MRRWFIIAAAVVAGGVVLFMAKPAAAGQGTGEGSELSPWEKARGMFGDLWTTVTGSRESADQMLRNEEELTQYINDRINEQRTGAAESVADQTNKVVDAITSWRPGSVMGALFGGR